jgi:hypothetical protein
MTVHEPFRRAISLHFEGRGSRATERALRGHCADCPECRDYYERHLLLSELDPTGLGSKQRIGRGLGLSNAPRRQAALGATLLAAAAATVFWFAPHRTRDNEFAARGATPERGAALDIYLVQGDGSARPVPAAIPANSELAFAYSSSGEQRYLMVFGVDEHGHVYWYHPEWSDPQADPAARSLSSQPGTFELPEAVTQPLDGRKLEVVGLFSKRELRVRAVEQVVNEALTQRQPLASALKAAFGEALVVEHELQVSQ